MNSELHSYILDSDSDVKNKTSVESKTVYAIEVFMNKHPKLFLNMIQETKLDLCCQVVFRGSFTVGGTNSFLPIYHLNIELGTDQKNFKYRLQNLIIHTIPTKYLIDSNYDIKLGLNMLRYVTRQ